MRPAAKGESQHGDAVHDSPPVRNAARRRSPSHAMCCPCCPPSCLVSYSAGTSRLCPHRPARDSRPTPRRPRKRPPSEVVELGAEHGEACLRIARPGPSGTCSAAVRGVVPRSADLTDGGGTIFRRSERGAGFLLRRHGKEWSDPVFDAVQRNEHRLSSRREGIAHARLALMTDGAVRQLREGQDRARPEPAASPPQRTGVGVSGTGGLKERAPK